MERRPGPQLAQAHIRRSGRSRWRAHDAPYDLRHSFISLLIAQGASVVEVTRQAGHAPTMTLDAYAHLFDEPDGGRTTSAEHVIRAARAAETVRFVSASRLRTCLRDTKPLEIRRALCRTRTDDPFLTMEVLYQLS